MSTAHIFKEIFSITPQKKTFNLPLVSYEKSDKLVSNGNSINKKIS